MNSESLDDSLRPYLPIFMDLLLESPIKRHEQLIPHEEVTSELAENTLLTWSGVGLFHSYFGIGPFPQTGMITLMTEPKKYKAAVNLLQRLLYCSKFTIERVRAVATRLLNRIIEEKNNGALIVGQVMKSIFYNPESNTKILTVEKQQKFLEVLLKGLKHDEKSAIILNNLYAIRKEMTRIDNVSLHIVTSISKCTKESINLSQVWKKIKPPKQIRTNVFRVIPNWKQMTYKGLGLKNGFTGTVIGIVSVGSSFLIHSVEAINDPLSRLLPAVMLYLKYLKQIDGPLWKRVQEPGLASMMYLVTRPYEGLLELRLENSSNVVDAFKEVKSVIEEHFRDCSWNDNMLQTAKGSLISSLIKSVGTIDSMIMEGLFMSFSHVPSNYNEFLVKQIRTVTKKELDYVGEKYISKLFSPLARTGIVCHLDEVQNIVNGFGAMGIKLEGVSCLKESILNT